MAIRNSVILLLLLAGCARQNPVTNAVQAAHATLADIETIVVAESCMTPTLQDKFVGLRQEIREIELACDTEVDKLQSRVSDWKGLTVLLALALALVLWLK